MSNRGIWDFGDTTLGAVEDEGWRRSAPGWIFSLTHHPSSLIAQSRAPQPFPFPSFSHSAPILALTAASMAMTSGHSRVKPSPGHFRVASMPSFPP